MWNNFSLQMPRTWSVSISIIQIGSYPKVGSWKSHCLLCFSEWVPSFHFQDIHHKWSQTTFSMSWLGWVLSFHENSLNLLQEIRVLLYIQLERLSCLYVPWKRASLQSYLITWEGVIGRYVMQSSLLCVHLCELMRYAVTIRLSSHARWSHIQI